MKTVARFGAIMSFGFCAIPAFWLIFKDNAESGPVLFGLFLLGIAIFAGSMVWLLGERCFPEKNGK